MSPLRPNFHCNFRAPNKEWFEIWKRFKEVTNSLGLDICYVVLNLCRAWLLAQEETRAICHTISGYQIIYVQQKNTFNYNVGKARREKLLIDCSKNLPQCTLCSKALQAYILEKARELGREFSFLDYREINHNLFRKLVLKLRKRGKIFQAIPRTNPQYFRLTEWKTRYPP